MRNLKIIVGLLAFTAILLSSCKKDEPNPQADSEFQEMANLLNSDWHISSENAVTLDDNTHDADWSNFSLSISDASEEGGTYTVSGVPSGYFKVWSSSGNWVFEDENDPNLILRSDGVSITILNIDVNQLSISFEVENEVPIGLRGIGGSWNFDFTSN